MSSVRRRRLTSTLTGSTQGWDDAPELATGYAKGYGIAQAAASPASGLWIDYSLARPSDAQMAAAGVVGVSRYLSFVNSLTIKKIIQPPEYEHHIEQGARIASSVVQNGLDHRNAQIIIDEHRHAPTPRLVREIRPDLVLVVADHLT